MTSTTKVKQIREGNVRKSLAYDAIEKLYKGSFGMPSDILH